MNLLMLAKNFLRLVFLSSVSVCLLETICAQYQVESWTTDNGLPQNTIRAILQTRDGYLWLATQDGVVRFDGVKFTVFNKHNSKGIRSNRFTSLKEDRNGNLWTTTDTVAVIISAGGETTLLTTEQGLIENSLTTIYEDREGNIWVGGYLRGLSRLSRQSVAFYTKKDGLQAESVYPIFKTAKIKSGLAAV